MGTLIDRLSGRSKLRVEGRHELRDAALSDWRGGVSEKDVDQSWRGPV
jgi:hypothetical protein